MNLKVIEMNNNEMNNNNKFSTEMSEKQKKFINNSILLFSISEKT